MSKRNDITDGIFATTKKYGLVYTEELGWIDLGHAQGQDARILKRKLEQEHFSTYYDEFHDWYFPVDYHQEMGIRKKILGVDLTFHTGVYTKVMVRSCLSPTLKARVALTLMYGTAKRFEAWQNSFIFNWYTDSGFSAEDLVSDLIGFIVYLEQAPIHFYWQNLYLTQKPYKYGIHMERQGILKILSLRHSYLQPILLLKNQLIKRSFQNG